MVKYVIKRIVLAFVTTFIILSITFILIKLLPFERPIGDDRAQTSYFDRQYNLGYVYRLDQPTDKYGELLYKSPANKGKTSYYYMVPVCKLAEEYRYRVGLG